MTNHPSVLEGFLPEQNENIQHRNYIQQRKIDWNQFKRKIIISAGILLLGYMFK
jgi:hypothetical protein